MAHPDRFLRLGVLLLALALTAASADEESETTSRLSEVEQAIDQARQARAALDGEAAAIAQEIDGLRARLLAAEAAMRAQEAALEEIALTLEALNGEMAERQAAFDVRRDEFGLVLAALQRIARQPAEMLLAMPTSPTDTHRTAMLLASLTPELDRRARAIADDIAVLAGLKQDIADQERAQIATLEVLTAERAASAAATIRKRALLAGVRREDSALAAEQERLAGEAGNLRELLDALSRSADGVPSEIATGTAVVEALAATSFSAQRGTLTLPVAGTIVTHFGEILPAGGDSEGIVIDARPGSRVVTPYDGRVVYAGPFRDYGHLLIIDHGEGYHTVLAGLARADVVLGQLLLASEPVGVMSSQDAAASGLYVELRRKGAPINPLPWMTAGANEVTGG
ncbi:MAG: peptidoglycan DD-metalloendopeptidase family protein [Proteobacteria bacterium]|nr:peptidoglycan DD-metalloendopeptidase family protein [Pseudomonadota bacterium]